MTTNNGSFNVKRGDLSIFDNLNRNRIQITQSGTLNVKDATNAVVTSITATGINSMGKRIVNVGNPTGDNDATNKIYVDNEISSLAASVGAGLIVRDPVVAKLPDADATSWLGDPSYVFNSSTITRAGGLPNIDNVAVVDGQRVLIANQDPSVYWGVYVKTNSTTLTRTDLDYAVNNYVLINGGTIHLNQGYIITSINAGAVDWTRFSNGGGSSGVTEHADLDGLGADDHTQYLLLAGRVGGQAITGPIAINNITTTTGNLTITPNLGELLIPNTGASNNSAATKKYVDDSISGGTVTSVAAGTHIGALADGLTIGGTATDPTIILDLTKATAVGTDSGVVSVSIGNAHIIDNTASTSTGTGALLVDGGVGIGGNVNVGGGIRVSGELRKEGTNTDLDIYANGTGRIMLNSSTVVDSNVNADPSNLDIGSLVTKGGLAVEQDIVVGGYVKSGGTDPDIDLVLMPKGTGVVNVPNLLVTGNITGGINNNELLSIQASVTPADGTVQILTETQATGTGVNDSAFYVAGGVGIVKNVYLGGDIRKDGATANHDLDIYAKGTGTVNVNSQLKTDSIQAINTNLTINTPSGQLFIPNTGANNNSAATKKYVDDSTTSAIITGKTLTGIDINTQGTVAGSDTILIAIGKLEATKIDTITSNTTPLLNIATVGNNTGISLDLTKATDIGTTTSSDLTLSSSGNSTNIAGNLDVNGTTNLEATTVTTFNATSNVTLGGQILGNVSLNPTGNIEIIGNKKITGLGTPTLANDAATKGYADAIAAGFGPKESCRYKTSASDNIKFLDPLQVTSSGTGVGKTLTKTGTLEILEIDGTPVNVNDRILFADSLPSVHYGIYTVTDIGSVSTSWILTRSSDADGSPSNELQPGTFVFVTAGATNINSGWTVLSYGGSIDSSTMTWTQVTQIGSGSLDHGTLVGRGDDDHTQYALLAGRGASQTFIGGSSNLILQGSNVNSATGAVQVSTDVDATSASSGALQIAGGVGVAKKLYVGDNTNSTNSTNGGAVFLGGVGIAQDLSLGTGVIQVNNNIATNQDLVLKSKGTGSVVIDGGKITTLSNQNLNLDANGSGIINVAKAMQVVSTLESNSISTGSITTLGGLGVAKNTFLGGNLNVAGTLFGTNVSGTNLTLRPNSADTITGYVRVNATTASTNTTTGAFVVDGGVGIGGALYVGNTINCNSTRITNVATPSFSADAATKGYVDNLSPSISTTFGTNALGQILIGGTQNVSINNNAGANLTNIGTGTTTGTVTIGGGTGLVSINGTTISCNSKRITDVATPTSSTDSATKEYIDTFTLVGDVNGTLGATVISAATVTGKALTGFVSGAGTVTASDTILSALQKINGNVSGVSTASATNFGTTAASTVTVGSTTQILNIRGNTSGTLVTSGVTINNNNGTSFTNIGTGGTTGRITIGRFSGANASCPVYINSPTAPSPGTNETCINYGLGSTDLKIGGNSQTFIDGSLGIRIGCNTISAASGSPHIEIGNDTSGNQIPNITLGTTFTGVIRIGTPTTTTGATTCFIHHNAGARITNIGTGSTTGTITLGNIDNQVLCESPVTSANSVVNKSYFNRNHVKIPVRVKTTVLLNNGNFAGDVLTASPSVALPVIDGITLSVGDRILNSDGDANNRAGIYVVTQTTAPWILTRADDVNVAFATSTTPNLFQGIEVYVLDGNTHKNQTWTLSDFPSPFTISTPQTWSLVTSNTSTATNFGTNAASDISIGKLNIITGIAGSGAYICSGGVGGTSNANAVVSIKSSVAGLSGSVNIAANTGTTETNIGTGSTTGLINIGNGSTAAATNNIRLLGINTRTTLTAGSTVLVGTAGDIGTVSSIRANKYNIEPFSAKYNSSTIIDQLSPQTYKFKANNVDSIGLMAEDVYPIIPEIVPTDNEGNPVSIRYDLLSVLLLEELKKQKAKVIELESKIDYIMSRLQ